MSGFEGFEGEQRSVGPYVIGRTLGSGMSGKVKLAIHSETGTTVALKCIDRTSLNERQYTNLEREIAAMRALEHPAVLRLYDFDMHASYTRVRGKGERAIVWLALEPAPGGELFDFLMYTGGFDEQSAASYFSQLLGALAAAHAIGISHRDIKPENILLDKNFGLKLADFGLAAIDHDPATGAAQLHRTECGTRSYMAPEILAHQAYDGCKADVWSAGVVAFIMIAGNPPFGQADSRDWWFKAISAGNYERFWKAHLRNVPTFPVGARTFLNRAFVAQPEARASVAELLTSPWLAAAASLGPAELAVKMADRKAVVDREKAAEAEAARKKKEAQRARRAANGGGGRAGGNYDAFARSVNRAAAASLAPPPLLPTGLHEGGDGHGLARYTQFYSCEVMSADVCVRLCVVMSSHRAPFFLPVHAQTGEPHLTFALIVTSRRRDVRSTRAPPSCSTPMSSSSSSPRSARNSP
jgi:serine/threonine protein kinase